MKKEYLKPTAEFLSLLASKDFALDLGDIDSHANDSNSLIGGSMDVEDSIFG